MKKTPYQIDPMAIIDERDPKKIEWMMRCHRTANAKKRAQCTEVPDINDAQRNHSKGVLNRLRVRLGYAVDQMSGKFNSFRDHVEQLSGKFGTFHDHIEQMSDKFQTFKDQVDQKLSGKYRSLPERK
jgi:hypothetical protein